MIPVQRRQKVLEFGGAPTIDNTVRPYYLCTDGGACISMHTLGWSGDMLPQKIFFKIRCSEIVSEAIFVLKFIFGLDAARILDPSVVGAPLAMTWQSVTGSHISRVSVSDVGLAVDWSQAAKVQN